MDFYIAQALSVIIALAAIASLQCKTIKGVLIFQSASNFFTALSFFLLDGLTGAGICLIAIGQIVVMYIYNMKKRKPHTWVLLLFIALYVACSILYFQTVFDIFSCFAAICFAISVSREKPTQLRIWSAISLSSWVVYDVVTMAYGNVLVHLAVLASGITALIRYRKTAE